MEPDPHRRARHLIEEARIAGIAPEEQGWLRAHLADCADCARADESLEQVVRGLKSFAFEMDPGAAGRVVQAVATRARKPVLARWWPLAAVFLAVSVVPLYQAVRDAQREKADALLLERVESRVGRAVPEAMEPLMQTRPEESK